jgi:hypothetical protein
MYLVLFSELIVSMYGEIIKSDISAKYLSKILQYRYLR